MFKKSQDEVHSGTIDEKEKSVAFRAQDSKIEEEGGCQEEESDEEMTLFVKRFNRMMIKKNIGKRGQSSRKNPFIDKTCFQCGELGNIIINCPNKKNARTRKTRKMMRGRRRRSSSRRREMVKPTLLSGIPMQSSDEEDDDDDKPSKGVARIAITFRHTTLSYGKWWCKGVAAKMMNLKNFHMMILLTYSMMPVNL